jgi:hypothetical protein
VESRFATVDLARCAAEEQVAVAAVRLRCLFASDLIRRLETGAESPFTDATVLVSQRAWERLATALASARSSIDVASITSGARPAARDGNAEFHVVALGRACAADDARAGAAAAAETLFRLLEDNVPLGDWERVDDPDELGRLARAIVPRHAMELRRAAPAANSDEPWVEQTRPGCDGRSPPPSATWEPSDDDWSALVAALARDGAALVVRVSAGGGAQLRDEPDRAAAGCTESGHACGRREERPRVRSRVSMGSDSTLDARVFVVGADAPSESTLMTAIGTLVGQVRPSADALRAPPAVTAVRVAADEISRLAGRSAGRPVSPYEATAILRCPLPGPGVARTFTIRAHVRGRQPGRAGTDVTVGEHVAPCGARSEVRLESETRFRHVHVVGRSGAGKSTLLARMAVEDAARGRGVFVLDPHGSLVEEILRHLPPARADDVVVVDPSDAECPVGLNPLSLAGAAPHRRCAARDRAIDDLLGFLNASFDMRACGGPVFEASLRGMIRLVTGDPAPEPWLTPSLLMLRFAFARKAVRDALATESARRIDPALASFVTELERTNGDVGMNNLSLYVSSKFARATDTLLRRMLCARRSLDFTDLVRRRSIVLCDLARGRLGRFEAELIAHQVVTGIRNAAWELRGTPDETPTYVYVDEFGFLARNDGFAEMLAESRKARMALVLSHQHAEQLPEHVLRSLQGNVGSTVALSVGARDAVLLAPTFGPAIGATDLALQPMRHAYVATIPGDGRAREVTSVELLPPLPRPDPGLAARVRETSRARHGTPAAVVDAEIAETIGRLERLK